MNLARHPVCNYSLEQICQKKTLSNLWYDTGILQKELDMFHLGGAEWIIILVIIILVFGPGRIGKVAGELGRSIKSFRDGLGGEGDQTKKDEDQENK